MVRCARRTHDMMVRLNSGSFSLRKYFLDTGILH